MQHVNFTANYYPKHVGNWTFFCWIYRACSTPQVRWSLTVASWCRCGSMSALVSLLIDSLSLLTKTGLRRRWSRYTRMVLLHCCQSGVGVFHCCQTGVGVFYCQVGVGVFCFIVVKLAWVGVIVVRLVWVSLSSSCCVSTPLCFFHVCFSVFFTAVGRLI